MQRSWYSIIYVRDNAHNISQFIIGEISWWLWNALTDHFTSRLMFMILSLSDFRYPTSSSLRAKQTLAFVITTATQTLTELSVSEHFHYIGTLNICTLVLCYSCYYVHATCMMLSIYLFIYSCSLLRSM